MTRLRVLHLEDSRLDAELVREMLAVNGLIADVERVETREQYCDALARGGYDVILADYSLPAFDGLTALELARNERPEIPFVFVTGALKDDSAVETLRRGATDFIVKQRLARLVPAIRRAIRERDDRAQRARMEAALQFIAMASARLASSLDLKAILGNLTRLVIPEMADFCFVQINSSGDGDTDHVATAHVDASKAGILQRLRFRSPVMPSVPELYDIVPDERLRALAINDEQLDILRALRPTSLMLVPMVAGGRALGTIAFGVSKSARRYDGRDLATAKSLSERAAAATENARLYREVQREVKSRKDLLAIVSHDLRSPLQSILVSATMIKHGIAADNPLHSKIDSIARSAGLASRLLGDLLDHAKFEAGNLTLDRRVQDIAPLVAESIDAVATLADDKHVAIVNAVQPGATRAFCDRRHVCQVLGNLIGNAIKFTPSGGTIKIAARPSLEGDEQVISVSDTGVGIPAADIPHLFERYWQAKSGRGGVGLGLTIVKSLVEAQGGRVSVTSKPGTGSTFSFSIPMHPVAPAANLAPTVLVVDDDADVRISVADVLEAAGYRTLTAGDGLEALELLRREPQLQPSVILLDLQMPKMDARAFRKEQEDDPALKDIAVIVFSADDDVEAVAEQLRASGHLHKPLGLQELLDAVKHCAPMGATPAASPPPQ
jgi:signal transduction histidine kinase/DNA-binding response OmpR family regulator